MDYFELHMDHFNAWKERNENFLKHINENEWEFLGKLEKYDINGKYFTLSSEMGLTHIKHEEPKPATINAWIDDPKGESLKEVIRRLVVFRTIKDDEKK